MRPTPLLPNTEQQAASLEQPAASVQELSVAVQKTAQTAQEVNQLTLRVRKTTEEGHTAKNTAVQSMTGIQEGSRKVQDIVGVINVIAFQTNILALNVAVEAARAGRGPGARLCRGGLRGGGQPAKVGTNQVAPKMSFALPLGDELILSAGVYKEFVG